jgi:hypothetical protein
VPRTKGDHRSNRPTSRVPDVVGQPHRCSYVHAVELSKGLVVKREKVHLLRELAGDWRSSRRIDCDTKSGVADIRLPESSGGKQRRDMPLAIAGTGYGLIGILVIILLVVLIMNFARRA